MLKYARGLRNQNPIWSRGHSRALSSILAGEYPIHSGTHDQSVMRAMAKDPTGKSSSRWSSRCPCVSPRWSRTRLGAASLRSMLFIEHEASAKGQDIIDKQDFMGSIFYQEAICQKRFRAKNSDHRFRRLHNSSKWMAMAVEAFGFPKESTK